MHLSRANPVNSFKAEANGLSDARKEFEKAAEEDRLSLAAEFWIFLRENKKWWLLPILLVFGAIAAFAALLSTGFAPFIYPAM
jgi:hypothetical protein